MFLVGKALAKFLISLASLGELIVSRGTGDAVSWLEDLGLLLKGMVFLFESVKVAVI